MIAEGKRANDVIQRIQAMLRKEKPRKLALYLNDVVDENFVLTPETFRQIRLPNAAGFFDDDRNTSERRFWKARPCMRNCKGEAKILNRARALDVTPDDKPGE